MLDARLVPADENANGREAGFEDAEAGVAGREVELLLIPAQHNPCMLRGQAQRQMARLKRIHSWQC